MGSLAKIANDNRRKSNLTKIRVSLFKKIEELSTLCEVETTDVVYSRGKERSSRYELIPIGDKHKNDEQETYLMERTKG